MRSKLVLALLGLLLVSILSQVDLVEAKKSAGNPLTQTGSKMVCGDTICDRQLTIAEKITMYLKETKSASSPSFSFGGIIPTFCNDMTIDQLISSGQYNVIDKRTKTSPYEGQGTSGADLYLASNHGDSFSGSGGDDCIIGGSGNDNLHGASGNDIIYGRGGFDNLMGAFGDDTCIDSSDSDFTGCDIILEETIEEPDPVPEPTGTIYCNDMTIDELINSGLYNVIDNSAMTSPQVGQGTSAADLYIASNYGDTFNGRNGDDCIIGGTGDDTFWGYYGEDAIYGNSGNDDLDGDSDDDLVSGGYGDDLINGGPGYGDICIKDQYDTEPLRRCDDIRVEDTTPPPELVPEPGVTSTISITNESLTIIEFGICTMDELSGTETCVFTCPNPPCNVTIEVEDPTETEVPESICEIDEVSGLESCITICPNPPCDITIDVPLPNLDPVICHTPELVLDPETGEFVCPEPTLIIDFDNDGIDDGIDNCPTVANYDQTDSDGNGIGNVCEDSDGDTIFDVVDNCPNVLNKAQDDSDGDGTGDYCETICLDPPGPPSGGFTVNPGSMGLVNPQDIAGIIFESSSLKIKYNDPYSTELILELNGIFGVNYRITSEDPLDFGAIGVLPVTTQPYVLSGQSEIDFSGFVMADQLDGIIIGSEGLPPIGLFEGSYYPDQSLFVEFTGEILIGSSNCEYLYIVDQEPK